MKIVLLSYTPKEFVGGVNRWVNDFRQGFPEAIHYSWWDVAYASGLNADLQTIPEWEKAKILSKWLLKNKLIEDKDIVIGDNWWVDGLEHRERTVCLAHGNWSHTTLEDERKGIPPEFPLHAAKQLEFRKRYLKAGRRLAAVSDFIALEMKRQWGFDSTVINNGIDLDKFKPKKLKLFREKPIIIHFTTTANKGLKYIEFLKKELDVNIWLLDEAAEKLNLSKYEALAQADLVVHPSAHEGNSFSILESLACNVPIVAYNVGLMFKAFEDGESYSLGSIIDRNYREDMQHFLREVKFTLDDFKDCPEEYFMRKWVETYSLDNFWKNWRDYLKQEFNYVKEEKNEL